MAFFLFPDVMYKRLEYAEEQLESANMRGYRVSIIPRELKDAYKLHQSLAKQYLGLGALLQFIPGTNQNRAREHLSKLLNKQIQHILHRIDIDSIDRATLSSISSYLNLAPLWRLVKEIKLGFGLNKTAGSDLDDFTLKLIINLPFLNDIIDESRDSRNFFMVKPKAIFSLMHSIINPARPIYSGLNITHLITTRFIVLFKDILTAFKAYGYPFKLLAKGAQKIADVVFGVLKAPVKMVEVSIDLLFDAIKTVFISPIKHVIDSIKFAAEGKEILVANVKELQDLKALRRYIKNSKWQGFDGFTKSRYSSISREYIGISKEELYGPDTNKARMVAVRASKSKIDQSSQLLTLIRFFKSGDPNRHIINDLDDVTRGHAKIILGK